MKISLKDVKLCWKALFKGVACGSFLSYKDKEITAPYLISRAVIMP